MKYIFNILIFSFISFSFSTNPIYLKNQFLFCLNKNVKPLTINNSNLKILTGINELDNWIETNNIKTIAPWLPIAHPDDHSGSIYLNRIYRLTLNKNNFNLIEKLRDDLNKFDFIHSTEPEYIRKPLYTPNDPQFNNQWFLPQVNATHAWDFWNISGDELPGNQNVILASVDTGVDWDHNDLVGSLWQNLGEDADGDGHTIEYINGQWALDPGDLNEIDDDNSDGNPATLIDDLIGWDCSGFNGEQDNDPRPGNGGGWSHGTHVAGLLNASTNNNTGVASVSFNSNVMSVKVSRESQQGQIYITEGYLGILYAAQAGHTAGSFSIINNSWGGIGYSTYEQEVINVAHNTYNAIVLAAAGNGDGGELYGTHYPSSYDNVISVTALGSNDSWNHWANYGPTVDLSSPGENIRSCTGNSSYQSWDGSSMASPVAASVFGLLKSYNMNWNNEMIQTMVLETANPVIYDINTETYLQGMLGKGKVDALTAITTPLFPKLEYSGEDIVILNDNDGVINPGEQINLSIILFNNVDWGDAINVSLLLESDANVEILNQNIFIGNISSGGVGINIEEPFEILFDSNLTESDVIFTLNILSNQSGYIAYTQSFPIILSVIENSMILGDINADSLINVLDVVQLVNIILSNSLNEAADLNQDNTINVQDIILLINLILG